MPVALSPTIWPLLLISRAKLEGPPRLPRSIRVVCAATGWLTTAMLARIIVDKTRLKRVKRGRCLLRCIGALLRAYQPNLHATRSRRLYARHTPHSPIDALV